METLTLSAPVQVSAGASAFRLWSLVLQRAHPDRSAVIVAVFREVDGAGIFMPLGRTVDCRYEGDAAEAALIALNKANLSTLSLEKRVTQKCQTDGKLGAGNITGTPD